MTKTIERIKSAIEASDSLDASLPHCLADTIEGTWSADYPIALVHTRSRITQEAVLSGLEANGLLQDNGTSPETPDPSVLETLRRQTPEALQCASLVELGTDAAVAFRAKRENDYWKKLADANHIRAVVECSLFDEGTETCAAEDALREIIRKRKEVPSLKPVPFIWISVTDDNAVIEPVMRHYFNDAYLTFTHLGRTVAIGWGSTLKSISMRYFVCPPAQEAS
jgi:hypothetical protein